MFEEKKNTKKLLCSKLKISHSTKKCYLNKTNKFVFLRKRRFIKMLLKNEDSCKKVFVFALART